MANYLRFFAVVMISGWACQAQSEQVDFVVVRQIVDVVMQPKNVADSLGECARNAVCRNAVEGAAQFLGVNPMIVKAGVAIVSEAKKDGEEGRFFISLPSGYQYCRSEIETISVVPATGDRASVMGATSARNGIGIYVWTPKLPPGSGRSWVEAKYSVYGVRDEIADEQRLNGKCRQFGLVVVNCRGARGTNKGMPACGNTRD